MTDLRSDILISETVAEDSIHGIVTQNMPRFIWRASILDHGGQPLLELLFDATDLGQAPCFLGYIPHKQGGSLLDFIRGTENKYFARNLSEVAHRYEWSPTIVKTLQALSERLKSPV